MNVLDENERAVLIDEIIDLSQPVPEKYRQHLGANVNLAIPPAMYTCFFYKVPNSDAGLYEMDEKTHLLRRHPKLPVGREAVLTRVRTSAFLGWICVRGIIGDDAVWNNHVSPPPPFYPKLCIPNDEVSSLRATVDDLVGKVATMQKQIALIYCAPGMPGCLEAAEKPQE